MLKNYFNWMYRLVFREEDDKSMSYQKLLHHLDRTEFVYTIPLDGCRAEDGINLRYRFGHEGRVPQAKIARYLDVRPCSILEMMVALALRCEDIMEDNVFGDRVPLWFHDMLVSLHLTEMDDYGYDPVYVDYVLNRFLDREYRPNGDGGLFTVHCYRGDMRSIEIWYQMCAYTNDILQRGV